MNVKKDFQAIVEFLQANENKKVGTILPELLEMVTAKSTQSASMYKDGKLHAVYCYYHKKWELVDEVEFGAKAGTKTGLNTMCKEGVSMWTKQQREAKVAKAKLLEEVANGQVQPQDLPAKLEEIEAARGVIVPRQDGKGLDTIE